MSSYNITINEQHEARTTLELNVDVLNLEYEPSSLVHIMIVFLCIERL